MTDRQTPTVVVVVVACAIFYFCFLIRYQGNEGKGREEPSEERHIKGT